MIKRALLVIFLTWIAIAPAIANSCASGCATDSGSMSHATHAIDADSPTSPPCHGAADEGNDSTMPDGSSMAVACFVASAASIPSVPVPFLLIETASEQRSVVVLPPLSFQTSAPDKPPQA